MKSLVITLWVAWQSQWITWRATNNIFLHGPIVLKLTLISADLSVNAFFKANQLNSLLADMDYHQTLLSCNEQRFDCKRQKSKKFDCKRKKGKKVWLQPACNQLSSLLTWTITRLWCSRYVLLCFKTSIFANQMFEGLPSVRGKLSWIVANICLEKEWNYMYGNFLTGQPQGLLRKMIYLFTACWCYKSAKWSDN